MSQWNRRGLLSAAAAAAFAGVAFGGVEQGVRSPTGLGSSDWRLMRNVLIERCEQTGAELAYDPFSVLVKFRDGVRVDAAGTAGLVGGRVIRSFEIVPGLYQFTVGGMTAEQALSTLNGAALSGLIEYAEPDYIVHATGIPNDSGFGSLWGMHNTGQTVNGDPGIADADIDAPEAWDVFTGSQSFKIGVIDTGIRYTHPDLSANVWTNPGEVAGNGIDDDGNGYKDDIHGYDFYNNDGDPMDDNGHGTHTSGTIGARGNNGIGVAGVNWQCSLVGLKFLSSGGSGATSDAISAVNYCRTMGIKVSNNSWGGGSFSSSLQSAIENAKSIGHIFVCAAGNSGTNNDSSPFYPANNNNTNLISVLATTNNDAKASFSNYGQTTVDIGAPGQTIYSTYGGSYAYLDGTSMASPHVAGVVALVYAKNPGWTWSQVATQVLSTARPVGSLSTRCVTGGIVNARDAIGGTPNTPPVITINSPTYGATFTQGDVVTFSTTTLDAEDGNISSQVTWTDNLNGLIGVGNFSTSSLSVGTHYIDVEVTDSGGLTDYVFLTIGINAASVPNQPTAVSTLEGAPGVLTFTWIDNSNNETKFNVQRQEKVGTWKNTTTVANPPANSTSYTESVSPGGWRYRVRAQGSSGYSAWTPFKMAKPATANGMTASASGSTANFSWSDNSGIEYQYTLQRQQKVGNAWTNTTTIGTAPADSTSSSDTPGTGTWRYRVQANSLGLSSNWSAWSKAVTIP
ncbi:MAG: S8 family serine peptidase [Phycisphaerales bacterium]|nr:S8 family serine peptidase [Phycisphaerales bacterium]